MFILIESDDGYTTTIIVGKDITELKDAIFQGYGELIQTAIREEDREYHLKQRDALLEMIYQDCWQEGVRVLENVKPIFQEWTIAVTEGSLFYRN